MGRKVKQKVRTTKISRKNQVTLPVGALAAAHVGPGDVLEVEVEGDGALRLVRHQNPLLDRLEAALGSAPGISEAADLENERDAWER